MTALPADRWQRLDDLLDEALARPPDARTAYLRVACGEDLELYREALALLESVDTAARALGESAADFAALVLADDSPEDANDLAPGTRVGPYRVEGEVGRGGMGVVYRAVRADGAFQREVALKLVKRGMDTDEVLRRFHREREVLAGLDHPGIARLLDGGAAADGRPFFAMEYVDGEPITGYADRRRLGVAERLALFAAVCEGVHHAHRRLVAHLDLKPSNILVTDGEGGPQVKLLDFGIARLLAAGTDEALTQPGRRHLTPAYAAPEQVRGEPVTTASDVYALGALLCELLAGGRPASQAGDGPDAAPRPPSARVTPESATARATTPDRLRRRLRGDLDTIVLKALQLEPGRRYASAEALAADLRRHAEGLPVEARPDSAAYRARRFVGRHRWGVAAAAAAALLLGAFSVVTARQAARLADERDRAQQGEAFLLGLFERAHPYQASGAAPTVREVLDRGTAALQSDAALAPETRARLYSAVGQAYYGIGENERAVTLIDSAYALHQSLHGPRSPEAMAVANQLANVLRTAGHYDAAADLYRTILDVRRATSGDASAEVARSLNGLALVLVMRGQSSEAERLLLDALAIDRRDAAREPAHLAQTLNNLGHARRDRRDLAGAEAAHRESLARRRALWGAEHFEVSVALSNLAGVLTERGAFGEADSLYRQGLALRRRLAGEGHPDLALDRAGYARLLHLRGDLAESERLYRQALAVLGRALPPEHPRLATARAGLGSVLLDLDRPEEAAPLLDAALAARRRALEPGHWQIAEVERALAAARGRAPDKSGGA